MTISDVGVCGDCVVDGSVERRNSAAITLGWFVPNRF